MKRVITIFLLTCLSLLSVAQNAFDRWHGDKYSMFIHFGLYSHLGGVWDGKPVTEGYSEQIQSFAGIFSDWYAMTADEFDPASFDASEIVALAQKAGMRSIVFTSKHHDGFCMFDTQTTEYNSVARTPAGRDYVRELSQACSDAGMKFGLYFSLIDWNYPHAYPISSHNADFVTPQHHELNKSQVRELLTNYGPVSELWFDMGALQPSQSQELYELVKQLQPQCMVSGRLGNDVYDFAVMADNKLPDVALHAPWQSAASMFPQTWSYRSWQERGNVDDKVAEKLRSLIDVVSRGGNYLLNIGPDASGAVVPFERDVLLKIGRWLEANGDAVYETSASPFATEFPWGKVTVKGKNMFLLLTGSYPEDGLVRLPLPEGERVVEVTRQMYADPADVDVVRLVLDKVPHRAIAPIDAKEVLSWKNATPDYSYSCFDYYSNYRSTVAYNWQVKSGRKVKGVRVQYARSDIGRRVKVQVGNKFFDVILGDDMVAMPETDVAVVSCEFARMRGGTFDRPVVSEDLAWTSVDSMNVACPVRPFSNYLIKAVLQSARACKVSLSVVTGNGMEVLIYDRKKGEYVTMMKHLNPYRSIAYEEDVLLDLEKGENIIILRSYNRFERELHMGVNHDPQQRVHVHEIIFDESLDADGDVRVRVSSSDSQSEHTDCRLHNLRINLIY